MKRPEGDSSSSTRKSLTSSPINNTFGRRFLTLSGYKLLRRFRPQRGVVVFLSKHICVKSGYFTHLSEASTMKFVAENTSIPVPKLYCSFVHNGRTYIVMERIQGEVLAHVWKSLSEASQAKILGQLAKFVRELRSLVQHEGFSVANVDGGSLCDGRIRGDSPRFGPFKTIQDFHKFLRGGLIREPGYDPEVDRMMELQDGPWPPPVFTHGDLSSLNILIRGDEVVGIVDWETAGWYPSYWEYTTACQVNPRNPFWREQIDKFLEPMPRELEMDQVRLKYFGDT